MKMAKASGRDIDAAGDAMSVLNDIASGYYPRRDGDDCEDTFFDPDDPAHLRKFYELIAATLDTAPGWPGRVIGGMCHVIMFDKNRIVDLASDVLDLNPRFRQAAQACELLQGTLQALVTEYGPQIEAMRADSPRRALWSKAVDATAGKARPPISTGLSLPSEAEVDEYLDEYKMVGEDATGEEGYYRPTDREKALIKGAIMGLFGGLTNTEAEAPDENTQPGRA